MDWGGVFLLAFLLVSVVAAFCYRPPALSMEDIDRNVCRKLRNDGWSETQIRLLMDNAGGTYDGGPGNETRKTCS